MRKQYQAVTAEEAVKVIKSGDHVHTPPLTVDMPEPNEVEKTIGRYCAELIEDGACLQMGIGSIPNAILSCLHNHKDLGSGAVTTRNHIHWFITEYGAVNLYGRSLQERAKLIISVAHPQFQEMLDEAAFKRFGSHFHYLWSHVQ